MLKTFWDAFKQEHPGHHVFKMADQGAVKLDTCIPLSLHGDGARTLKKQPLEVLSVHPILGIDTLEADKMCTCDGSQCYSGSDCGSPFAQRLNTKGHTYVTHFLLFVLPTKRYKSHPGLLMSLLEQSSRDLRDVCDAGVVHGADTYNFAVVGALGDAEWHSKTGLLTRSYQNVGHRNPKPCCSECLAGSPNTPFEDFRPQAAWRQTLYASVPWLGRPPFHHLGFEDWDSGGSARFFKRDHFHIFRLGIARQFIASSLILLCNEGWFDSEGDSRAIDVRLMRAWDWCTLWRETHGYRLTIRSFNRQKLHYGTMDSFPWIGCKGSDTPLLLKFLDWFAKLHRASNPESQSLALITRACEGGLALQCIYNHGVWLSRRCAKSVLTNVRRFLGSYAELASLANQRGMTLYAMVPKAHALDHIGFSLEEALRKAQALCINPAVWDCATSEDFVGRVARASRRVSHKHPELNSLLSWRVKAKLVIKRFKEKRQLRI